MPSGGAARKATCNTLGGGGGVSAAAGKARRCVPPPGAPAGGEQEGASNQHARDAGAAQRDDQRASARRTVGRVMCAHMLAVSGVRRQAGVMEDRSLGYVRLPSDKPVPPQKAPSSAVPSGDAGGGGAG